MRMQQNLVKIVALALLSVSLSGCTTLRNWLAPYQGMNSDTWANEPGVGQYQQPPSIGEPER
jgi:hypothetical protein